MQKFTSVLSDTPADLMPVPSLDVVAQEFIDRRVRQEHEEDMITTDSARTILRLQDELNTSIASANLAYSTLGTSLKVRERFGPMPLVELGGEGRGGNLYQSVCLSVCLSRRIHTRTDITTVTAPFTLSS